VTADRDVQRSSSLPAIPFMLEALVADAAIGIGLFDRELRYLRINDALQTIIGVPAEQLHGRSVREVLPDFGDTVYQAQREALESGVPVHDLELWGRTPADPGPRRCYSCSYFRLHAPDGTILGLASIVTDVTEARRSAVALAAAHERLALLSRVGQIVGSSLSSRDTLSALAAVTVPRFADHCVVDLLDEQRPGETGLQRAALVNAPELRDAGQTAWRGTSGPVSYPPAHPVSLALMSGRPQLLREVPQAVIDASPTPESARFASAIGLHSMMTLPLRRRDQTRGVLSFARSVNDRPYDDEDLALAIEIAGRFSVALDNAHAYESQQLVALTLQRSMLPAQLPPAEGLEPESVYLPGGGDTEVGGDWFDLIPLSTGRTGIVIGDVMGRGVHAAAVMGQLRAATRAFAVLDLAPATVLHQLDELVTALEAIQLVTCVYAVFDPATGVLTAANAGHLPPLLLRDGSATRLPLESGTLLGLGDSRFSEQQIPLQPGDAVVLYTDGLVETRGSDLDEGIERLCQALSASAPVGRTCATALRTMLAVPAIPDLPDGPEDDADYDDDVAMLVLRATGHRSGREPLILTLPARIEAPRQARDGARTAALGWGLGHDVADTTALVVSELVTNAVLHTGSALTVRLRPADHVLHVEVLDDDSRPPRMRDPLDDEDSGRGLHLVEALSRRWGIRTLDTGKVVWSEIPC
jgi:PAS domain S-box-containing protein